MPNLRVIYTPETDHFRLDDIQMIGHHQPNDPLLAKLRENYHKLRGAIPNLPSQVGVVTYDFIFKRTSREKYEDRKSDDLIPNATHYTPLDIMEAALALRDEDVSDRLSEEYVYRALGAIFCDSSIGLDKTMPERALWIVLHAPTMPMTISTAEKYEANVRNLPEKLRRSPLAETMLNTAAKLRKGMPSWEDLQDFYEQLRARFDANKVSRALPLYYNNPSLIYPAFYAVSLVDEIETPDYIPEVLRIVKLGAKAQGLDEVPEHIKQEVLKGQKDKFAEAKRILSMDELLSSLPEPKTIITDLYITDQCPQLKEIGFEAVEFKLE